MTMYYPPESNPPANRMAHLARVLVQKYGHEYVRVVTGRPNYPEGVLPREFKWRLFKRGVGAAGERVDHVYELAVPFRGVGLKTLGMLSYTISVFLYFAFRRFRSEDIVFVTSGPVFPAYAVALLSRLRKSLRYVIDVRDLWPQVVAGMGFMHLDSPSYRTLMKLSDGTYRHAIAQVANVKGIKEYMDSVIQEDATFLVYNPVNTELFAPVDKDTLEAFKADHPEIFDGDKTVFLFAGRHSVAIDLGTFVSALKLLRDKTDAFRAVLIGYGETKEGLQDYVKKNELDRQVRFLSHMPREELVKYICAADFCFSSTKDEEINDMVVPTKMTEYLSCNKFVVAAHRCPFADEIAAHGDAVVSAPGDVESLAEKLYSCIQNRRVLQEQVTSRNYILEKFSVERFEQGFGAFFESLITSSEETGSRDVHCSS